MTTKQTRLAEVRSDAPFAGATPPVKAQPGTMERLNQRFQSQTPISQSGLGRYSPETEGDPQIPDMSAGDKRCMEALLSGGTVHTDLGSNVYQVRPGNLPMSKDFFELLHRNGGVEVAPGSGSSHLIYKLGPDFKQTKRQSEMHKGSDGDEQPSIPDYVKDILHIGWR